MADIPNEQTVPAGQQDGSEEPGFAAAFSERGADPQRDEARQPTDGDKPSDQGPPAGGSNDTAPAAAAAETVSSGFDPWDGLTPEQKSHFERLANSERSNRGRVGALTRKLNHQLAPRAAEPPQRPADDQHADDQEDKAPAEASDLDKRLQSVVDEYGDVVGPIAEVLKQVRDEVASLKSVTAQVEVETDAKAIAEAYTSLEQVHPDYAAVAADANFGTWLGDQPKQIIDLANSFDPREVSLALTLFKTERSDAMAPAPSSAPGNQGHSATDKRARQLEGSRQVAGRGAPAVAGVPDDFGSAFKARATSPR